MFTNSSSRRVHAFIATVGLALALLPAAAAAQAPPVIVVAAPARADLARAAQL